VPARSGAAASVKAPLATRHSDGEIDPRNTADLGGTQSTIEKLRTDRSLTPIPEAGAPEDIAQAAVYLASDGSRFVNGHELVVDGANSIIGRGWSAGLALRAELASRIRAQLDAIGSSS
jgi:NAD(P)-dependent dehydrogenase (short-subunit alcohol dehydrogenase family)